MTDTVVCSMSSSSISWCSWNKKLWQQQQLDRALIQEIGPCCISVSLLWQNIAGALRIIMAKTQLSNPRPLTFTPEPLTLTVGGLHIYELWLAAVRRFCSRFTLITSTVQRLSALWAY